MCGGACITVPGSANNLEFVPKIPSYRVFFQPHHNVRQSMQRPSVECNKAVLHSLKKGHLIGCLHATLLVPEDLKLIWAANKSSCRGHEKLGKKRKVSTVPCALYMHKRIAIQQRGIMYLVAEEHGGELVHGSARQLGVVWRAQVEHAGQANVQEAQRLVLLVHALLACTQEAFIFQPNSSVTAASVCLCCMFTPFEAIYLQRTRQLQHCCSSGQVRENACAFHPQHASWIRSDSVFLHCEVMSCEDFFKQADRTFTAAPACKQGLERDYRREKRQ